MTSFYHTIINIIFSFKRQIFLLGDDTIATLGSSDFVIGNHEFQHKGGIYKLNAYVGLVRIWKNALDNNEISQLYEHSKERFLKK